MRVLLTNDDGIHSAGLKALADACLERGHTVTVCAPASQQSAASQRITITAPLMVRSVPWEGAKAWAVQGSPADCARLGLRLAEEPVAFGPSDARDRRRHFAWKLGIKFADLFVDVASGGDEMLALKVRQRLKEDRSQLEVERYVGAGCEVLLAFEGVLERALHDVFRRQSLEKKRIHPFLRFLLFLLSTHFHPTQPPVLLSAVRFRLFRRQSTGSIPAF